MNRAAEEDGYLSRSARAWRWTTTQVETAALVAPAEEDVTRCRTTRPLLVIAGPDRAELPPCARGRAEFLHGRPRTPTASRAVRRARVIFLAEPDTHDTFRAFLAFWGVLVADGYIRRRRGLSAQRAAHTCAWGSTTRRLRRRSWRLSGRAVCRWLSCRERPPWSRCPKTPPRACRAPIAATTRVGPPDRATSSARIRWMATLTAGIFPRRCTWTSLRPVGAAAPTARPPDNEIAGMAVFGDSDFVSPTGTWIAVRAPPCS